MATKRDDTLTDFADILLMTERCKYCDMPRFEGCTNTRQRKDCTDYKAYKDPMYGKRQEPPKAAEQPEEPEEDSVSNLLDRLLSDEEAQRQAA